MPICEIQINIILIIQQYNNTISIKGKLLIGFNLYHKYRVFKRKHKLQFIMILCIKIYLFDLKIVK